MLSVTQRLETVSQPQGGYVPTELFTVKQYEDRHEVKSLNATLYSIQGMVVDYMTRFIRTNDLISSFSVSIEGAKIIDEAYENHNEVTNILKLLQGIKGLDRQSIANACRVVCYDSAKRKGLKYFQSPNDVEFTEDLYNNVKILVERSMAFLEKNGPVVSSGFTFAGGYTSLVSTGDGDYLTKNTLIDFKVSTKDLSTKWSLQLLMYYLLGIHSVHAEFSSITKLCIYNPYKNQSYTCNIKDISDESKWKVSHDVLGYDMQVWFDFSSWRKVNGSDESVLRKFLTDNFTETDFKIENYENGIYDITLDDYWTFLHSTLEEYQYTLRPVFRHTKYVKLIKRNGYYMFISVSHSDKYSILHGARLHAIKFSLEYFYDNIERYGLSVINHFSKYWDALYEISKQLQSLKPSEKFLRSKYSEYLREMKARGYIKKECSSFAEWCEEEGREYDVSGKIHGCIVDIDFNNHIYLNPYDSKLIPYSAVSMYDKNVYKNTRSLLSAERPDLLPAFETFITDKKSGTTLLAQNQAHENQLVPMDDAISKDFVKVYDYDMYEISNKLKPLQNIYDIGLVQVWYDEILGDNRLLLEDKYKLKPPQKKRRFQHIPINDKTLKGKPTNAKEQKQTFIERQKEKYIGMTNRMNCGLIAEIIDYENCDNITIRFEDGCEKSGVRVDKFKEGKVGHP